MTGPARRIAVLLVGCAGALLIAGCRSAPPPPDETPVAPVKAEHAGHADFGEWTELIGATQALPGRAARITAPVEGHVVSVLTDENGKPVGEGQTVERGQLVARLDDRIVRAQHDKMLAMLDELTETRKQADIAYQSASLDVDRLTKLNPVGTPETSLPLVSKIEIEKARLALKDAESKQRAVTAKEKTLRADLHVLDLNLEYHQLRAPIKGVLGAIQVVPGQTLAIGTAVADVTDLSDIDVVAFAPPSLARKLRQGDAAFYIGAEAGQPHRDGPEGRVVFVAEQAQPDTGNILVKTRFPNKSGLRANQVTRIVAQTQPVQPRLVIPASAIMEDQDPPLVVVAEDVEVKKGEHGDEHIGKARRLRAYLGLRDRSHHVVEILRLEDVAAKKDVLPADALFIVEGGHGLHDGDLVKVEQKKEQ